MAERTLKEEDIIIGQLIKWYELYADGYLVRDAGNGIVLNIDSRSYPGYEPYSMYTVYRTKHNDTMIFPITELEQINIK